MSKPKKPEWAPEKDESRAFTTSVMPGVDGGHDGMDKDEKLSPAPRPQRIVLSVEDYVEGVLARDRMILGRTITLIESNAESHQQKAQEVLKTLLPHTGNSIRIGISGVPGAGKSTFIEAFGTFLCEGGHRVAVLAVDPSSSVSRGSILGDKTRMEKLSQHESSFIRPSPSGGVLGGVARKTRETMLVCEAAGFDVILVETVGVGQSEATVRSMVDFFLLLSITGAGDELQNIKKGVIELSDAIIINKADGDNLTRALTTQADFNQALHYLTPFTDDWEVKAFCCSALEGRGISEIWDLVTEFRSKTTESGFFSKRRKDQLLQWVDSMVFEKLKNKFLSHAGVAALYPKIQEQLNKGEIPATSAAESLLEEFEKN